MKKPFWKVFDVTVRFRSRLYGGIPASPVMIRSWLRARMREASERERERVAEETAKAVKQVKAKEKEMTTTFKADERGVYIEARQVKAMLRESASALGLIRRGPASLKQPLQHGVAVGPEKIYLTRDGKHIAEVDGFEERPIHVVTRRGARTALRRMAFVERPECRFQIHVATPEIDDETVERLVMWGQELGLGADRSQEHGKFDVTGFGRVE